LFIVVSKGWRSSTGADHADGGAPALFQVEQARNLLGHWPPA
jgi:hypothetical protein